MKRRCFVTCIVGAAASLHATQTLAHHVLDGDTPSNFFQGLLSGVAHPMIGVDHLAFLIAMGIAVAFMARSLVTPLVFVIGTIVGCLLSVAGVILPISEIAITASVVVVGAMVLSGHRFPAMLYIALFAAGGVFHGWAYGAAIVGAEATPLLAYLLGFACIQYVIAVFAGTVVRRVWHATDTRALHPRLAGALVAGIGLAFLIENIEGLILG